MAYFIKETVHGFREPMEFKEAGLQLQGTNGMQGSGFTVAGNQ